MWSVLVRTPDALSPSPEISGLNSFTFRKKLRTIFIMLFIPGFCFCQFDSLNGSIQRPAALAYTYLSKQEKTNRQIFIGAVNVVGYGGSLIILSNTWYKNYPHTSFHTFNDAGEWLQVDKFGHAWTAYNTGESFRRHVAMGGSATKNNQLSLAVLVAHVYLTALNSWMPTRLNGDGVGVI